MKILISRNGDFSFYKIRWRIKLNHHLSFLKSFFLHTVTLFKLDGKHDLSLTYVRAINGRGVNILFCFSTQTFRLCNKIKTKSQSIHFHNTLTPRLKWQKKGEKKIAKK